MASADKDNLSVYEAHPPSWLPKAHQTADLGFVGFYPPRPDQEEEVLSENNVKNGLTLGLSVPAENFSAHESVAPRLLFEDAIADLENVMNQVFSRKEESIPPVPPWSFRLPSRVTLNDAKRQAWFADLANPDVPLAKLGKSVPHGAKGHDLLDLMHANNVSIPRAVWFLRVFGGNETAGLRNKPAYNPTQYSVEWANVVNGYLKKQLGDIALPMAPRPGLNIKQVFRGVLSDVDSRQRWISRFTYSLNLLRSFYMEGLVDNRTFLAWVVQQFGASNLAQLGFVAHLADEYIDGMLVTRALMRPFVEACINRLLEIRQALAQEQLVNLEKLVKNLLMRAFLGLPSAFINPRNWAQHSSILLEVIQEYTKDGPLAGRPHFNPQALCATFSASYEDIKERNEAMLFRKLPPRILGPLSSVLSEIKLLNSLSTSSDIGSVTYFEQSLEESSTFTRKLDILLTWSVTTLQYGDHRPYAASSLLCCWRDLREDRESTTVNEFIQDQLFDWLDCCDVAIQPESLRNVALLFGQLIKRGLFSYNQYIQRLIARGELGLSFSENFPSRHRNFLRWIPIYDSPLALVNHRKVTLYGVRMRETPEDTNEREIRKEIRALLPELYDGEPIPLTNFFDDLEGSCKLMFSSPLYEQLRVIRGWLIPHLKQHITSLSTYAPNIDESIDKIFCISMMLMAHCRAYAPILEWSLFVLERATSSQLLIAVIETLKQHSEVWTCMNAAKSITTSLFQKHQALKSRGNQNSHILNFIVEMDRGKFLDSSAREMVHSDRAAYMNALRPTVTHLESTPITLPEVLLLSGNTSPDASSMLANSLWYKYRSTADWGWKAWDNTIDSLRHLPSTIHDPTERRRCALRYASFLYHVDHHLPDGIHGHVLDWLQGSGKSKMISLDADVWDVTIVIFLQLVIYGALSATTLLQGLVYPAWQSASTVTSALEGSSLEVQLSAVNELCTRLLLRRECGGEFPPSSLLEARGLQARRREVFRPPHFTSLVDSIPILVLAELNPHLPLTVKEKFHLLRKSLCQVNLFRQGIYRDLDAVHRAFGKFLDNQSTSEVLHEPLINALRIMLNDGSTSPEDGAKWHQLSTFLSPWKLAATSIEMRFSMKQLDMALAGETTRDRANAYLDKFTMTTFRQAITSEEGDLLAEMLKGASVAIAGKFINAGLQRITEMIADPKAADPTECARIMSNAGDMLRLLANIVKPFRNEPSAMPKIQDRVQYDVLSGLCSLLVSVVDTVSTGAQVEQMINGTFFLTRVIHFVLGFPGVWTDETVVLGGRLCIALVRLATLLGSGLTSDPLVFPLLLDTLYYVLDEIPIDTKAPTYDLFRHYPDFELQALPLGMPTEYRRQMRTLLPYTDLNRSVAYLAYASTDGSGTTTGLVPMQNRPWEWTENLGDCVIPDASGEKDSDENHNVKNVASISLELFNAQLTGEHVLHPEAIGSPHVFKALRTLKEHLYGESVFQRDFREARVPSEHTPHPAVDRNDTAAPFLAHTPHDTPVRQSHTRGVRKHSPVFSARSRDSSHSQDASSADSAFGPESVADSISDNVCDTDSPKIISPDGFSTTKRKAEELSRVDGPNSKRIRGG